MNGMTVLRRCLTADGEIAAIRGMIRRREDAMRQIGGMRMDPIGGGKGTGDGDRYGRMMGEISELEDRLRDRQEARTAEAMSAVSILDMVEDELEREVLHRYYLLKEKTGDIARAKKYGEGYVRKKKREGETTVGEIPGEKIDGTLPGWYLKKWKEE